MGSSCGVAVSVNRSNEVWKGRNRGCKVIAGERWVCAGVGVCAAKGEKEKKISSVDME